jgi:hypothetical protein
MFILKSLEGEVVFQRFRWSGSNSHRARMKAADALRKALEQTILEHPNARHYVITHGNGENILIRAIIRLLLRMELSAITALISAVVSIEDSSAGCCRCDANARFASRQ